MDISVAFEDVYKETSCMIVSSINDDFDIVEIAKKFCSDHLMDFDRWDVYSSGRVSFMFCEWLFCMCEGSDFADTLSIESMDDYQPVNGCHIFDIVSGSLDRIIKWQ